MLPTNHSCGIAAAVIPGLGRHQYPAENSAGAVCIAKVSRNNDTTVQYRSTSGDAIEGIVHQEPLFFPHHNNIHIAYRKVGLHGLSKSILRSDL